MKNLAWTVSLLFIACASQSDMWQSQSAPITAGTLGTIVPSVSEPSIAATPGGRTKFVTAYNDSGGPSILGWAFSSNHITWSKCNAVGTGCGGGISTANIPGFKHWLSNAAVASDGTNVILAALVDTDNDQSTAEEIVVALSTTGGQSFQAASPINVDSCSGGKQELPHVAFDMTTVPPVAWVAWRHENSAVGSTFGACVRRLTVTGGALDFLGDTAKSVLNMDREDSLYGQGAEMVQAGGGAVTVVYMNTDHKYVCPDASLRGFAVASVTSYDNGTTWSPNSRIFHTSAFKWCVDQGKVQMSQRPFGFARATNGHYYVAFQDSETSLRLFRSANQGWTWQERCSSDWNQGGTPPPTCAQSYVSGAAALAFPDIAADHAGRIVTAFYQANADATLTAQVKGNPAPDVVGTADQGQIAIGTAVQPGANTAFLGLYESMVVLTNLTCGGSDTFVPAWTASSGISQQIQAIDVVMP